MAESGTLGPDVLMPNARVNSWYTESPLDLLNLEKEQACKGNAYPAGNAPLLVGIALWAVLMQTWSVCVAQTPAAYHSRADQALQSFLLKFWSGDRQYLKQQFPDNGALTGYWTYANGWDAVMDGVERTGGEQYLGLIETFYLGQDERGWWAGYYDDECWMTLALIRAYDLTGNQKYLAQAQTIYGDVMAGWVTTCCGAQ